jgi:hypothetical protein
MPAVLTPDEVVRLFKAVPNPKIHTALITIYAYFRGLCAHRPRHQQRAHGHRSALGQKAQRPLCDSVRAAARHSARLPGSAGSASVISATRSITASVSGGSPVSRWTYIVPTPPRPAAQSAHATHAFAGLFPVDHGFQPFPVAQIQPDYPARLACPRANWNPSSAPIQ